MATNYSLRELLYQGEHESCSKYIPSSRLGFRYYRGKAHASFTDESMEEHTLMFLLKGSLHIRRNEGQKFLMNEAQVTLFSKSETVYVETLTDVELVTLTFSVPESGCDKLTMEALASYLPASPAPFFALDLCRPFDVFLEGLKYCLEKKVFCYHYHTLKERELLLMLRVFYRKEEIAALFAPLISKDMDFKDFVLKNYKKVNQVNDLVALSHMSKSVFFTKFKEAFGMTAKQWMVQQTNERIRNLLSQPGVKMKDVMFRLNFNSSSYFSRYCLQQFGCKPSELAQRYSCHPNEE